MASYRPLRLCKCGKCECDLGTIQEKDREEDKVHQYLFGLDDTLFHTVRSSLVSRIPIQSMEEEYNIVCQEEDMGQNSTKSMEEQQEVAAFAVQSRPQYRREDKEKSAVCKHCNYAGHSFESCYAIIGYPEWWGDRPKSRSTQGCGHGGAISAAGIGRGRRVVSYANVVHVSALTNYEHVNYVITDKDRDGVTRLSDDQWRGIMNLLNAGKNNQNERLSGKNPIPFWIFDMGASHHLTGRLDILSNLRDMVLVMIILADGRERVSMTEGTISLGSNLNLQSIFYAEGLCSDLISVEQLMDDNNCVVQMADHYLVVQDRTSRMVIGVDKRETGTFRLCSSETVNSVTIQSVDSYDLWHHRLGHPSAKIVGLLPDVSFPISSEILNKMCDVCLRAKQTRACFPISLNKTVEVFQLIHCDLWGLYRTPTHCGARCFLTIVNDLSRGVWLFLLNEKS